MENTEIYGSECPKIYFNIYIYIHLLCHNKVIPLVAPCLHDSLAVVFMYIPRIMCDHQSVAKIKPKAWPALQARTRLILALLASCQNACTAIYGGVVVLLWA